MILILTNTLRKKGLKTVNDAGELQAVVEQVIRDNPQSVEDYHNGKEKAIGFLVGQTMKAMKGKANPGMVNKILKRIAVNRNLKILAPHLWKWHNQKE